LHRRMPLRSKRAAHILRLWRKQIVLIAKAAVGRSSNGPRKVRKRLLLVLPQGDKYLYVCPDCGSTCGETIETPPPLVR